MLRSLSLLVSLVACGGRGVDSVPSDSGPPGDTNQGDSAVGSDSSSDSGAGAIRDTFTDGSFTAMVELVDPSAAYRTYVISSDHPLRDGLPASGSVTVREVPGGLRLRSGRALMDALFALAMQEVRDASVSTISDGAFSAAESCPCFETGERWTWVWTRDTAYAVEHSLALIDPQRARDSLRFKLSDRKAALGGGFPTIVQDTGTGGSWPVSTDRVVWAMGAWEVLKYLDGAEREAFRDEALLAMRNTLEEDRQFVFDAEDGLYRGEQSFLDWREQTYPTWTATDTVHIASSKCLSTNMGHLRLMQVTAALADEVGDSAGAERYRGWADALSLAIDRELWQADAGLYSTMKLTTLDPAPVRKWDLLGESMAALWLTDEARAAEMVAAYPHAAGGPPVIWPQQPFTPIYHNRGVWPFVTAYDLRAARRAGNATVFVHDARSLVRGAALNLSNMENFEFLTGANFYEDGLYSGPVINSRRQLWSVAAFVALVTRGIFGMEASQTDLSVSPFLPAPLYEEFLGPGPIQLLGVPWRGASLDITLQAPGDVSGSGAFEVEAITLDGTPVTGPIAPGPGSHALEVRLGPATSAAGSMTMAVDDGDFTKLYAPREPNLTALSEVAGALTLAFDSAGEAGVTFDVFRNGERVATGLSGPTWTDPTGDLARSDCYAVASVFPSSGHVSQHSPAVCWWGASYERITTYDHGAFVAAGGNLVTAYGRTFYENWGARDHTLTIEVQPPQSGRYALQVTYGNGAGTPQTGITVGHKRVRVFDGPTEVASGAFVLPHLGSWDRWEDSNFVPVRFDGAGPYTVVIDAAPNMSWLARHGTYTGSGGGLDTYDYVNIAELKLLRRGD